MYNSSPWKKKTIGDPSSPPLNVTEVYFVKVPRPLALALNLNLGVGIAEVYCGTAYLCGSDNRHPLVNLKPSDIILIIKQQYLHTAFL